MLKKILYWTLLFLLKPFYPRLTGANPLHILGTVFFVQKILGINRFVPWPVHYTSRVIYPKKVKLGRRSFPGWSSGCYIQARNGINIGHNLRMGPNVGLISSNHNIEDYDEWDTCDPINIGNNVWLGMGAIVMPGVTIGDNVVVGANSVVTKNIPSNSIAMGVPCHVVKQKLPYRGKRY